MLRRPSDCCAAVGTTFLVKLVVIALAAIAALAICSCLSGCYLMPKDLVGQAPGIMIMNNTDYTLQVWRNGSENLGALHPSEHLVIGVMRRYDNHSENISILAKAIGSPNGFMGVAERTFTISQWYSAGSGYGGNYGNNLPQSWVVRNGDICR